MTDISGASNPYKLTGTAQADTFTEIEGVSFIDGGDGYDTVSFAREPAAYRVRKVSTNGFSAFNPRTGGTIIIINVEAFTFMGRAYVWDDLVGGLIPKIVQPAKPEPAKPEPTALDLARALVAKLESGK